MNGIFTGIIRLRGWNPFIKIVNDRDATTSLIGSNGDKTEVNSVNFGLKTIKKTIGAFGVAGCDFNFTAPANGNAQNIDLGEIVPANARVLEVRVRNTATFTGLVSLAITAGNVSTGAQFLASVQAFTLNTIVGTLANILWTVVPNSAATHVFVGVTPGANWNLCTVGKLEVNVSYFECLSLTVPTPTPTPTASPTASPTPTPST